MMTQEMNKNEQKPNNNLGKINFPFKIKHRLGPVKIPGIGMPQPNKIIPGPSRQLLKEPIAFIIKSNYEVDIREGVKEGYISLERKIGDSIETVRIFNPKSKLLSFPIGGTVYRGWILDEKEAVALPTDIKHDSLILKRIMEALMLNYEEFKTKRIKQWMQVIKWLVIGIIGLIFVMGVMQISFADIMGWETAGSSAAGTVQTINYIIDANAITSSGII